MSPLNLLDAFLAGIAGGLLGYLVGDFLHLRVTTWREGRRFRRLERNSKHFPEDTPRGRNRNG